VNTPTDEFERPSKSALKREAEELQQLGEALIDLPDAVLEQLPLPETLRDAVANARRFTSHGAQLRQRQYIGKLMRKVDVEPIRRALESRQLEQRLEARRFQRIEQWRERLIREPDIAVPELLAELPGADVARLRSLATEAAKDARDGATPRAARLLFHYLRELFSLQ
jgi:ribosome-associated protein